MELKNKISQLHSFIDEAFDVKKTSGFHLLLSIGLDFNTFGGGQLLQGFDDVSRFIGLATIGHRGEIR